MENFVQGTFTPPLVGNGNFCRVSIEGMNAIYNPDHFPDLEVPSQSSTFATLHGLYFLPPRCRLCQVTTRRLFPFMSPPRKLGCGTDFWLDLIHLTKDTSYTQSLWMSVDHFELDVFQGCRLSW